MGPEANYTNVGEEPTYATIDDARQLQPFLEQQKYPIEPGGSSSMRNPELTSSGQDHHLSSDSLDQWQESYLDSNNSNNNHQQQPYSGFPHNQNGWSSSNNTSSQQTTFNGMNSFSGSQYGGSSDVDEYSSVLRNSSYALLSLGPKSITGSHMGGNITGSHMGGNIGNKQPGHFHSLPYIGAQVKPSSNQGRKENEGPLKELNDKV